MVKYDKISVQAPLAEAFRSVGQPTIATIISIGALAGLTTVMMILMIGQSRVFFAMRPAAAADLRHRERAHRDTGADDDDHRGGDRRDGGPSPARGACRAGEHRHAVRLHRGVDRRAGPAPHPA